MKYILKTSCLIFLICFSGFPAKLSLGIDGNIDSIVLHYESLRYCNVADTIDSCETILDSSFYSLLSTDISVLNQYFLDFGACCGERRIAYLDITFRKYLSGSSNRSFPSNHFRIYLWDCYMENGYLYLNDDLFSFHFSDSLKMKLDRIIKLKSSKVFTVKGLNRNIKNRYNILSNVTPILKHINEFDGSRLDVIERPQKNKILQIPEGRLAVLRDKVNNFKKDMNNLGLTVYWDTVNYKYTLKWKDSVTLIK